MAHISITALIDPGEDTTTEGGQQPVLLGTTSDPFRVSVAASLDQIDDIGGLIQTAVADERDRRAQAAA